MPRYYPKAAATVEAMQYKPLDLSMFIQYLFVQASEHNIKLTDVSVAPADKTQGIFFVTLSIANGNKTEKLVVRPHDYVVIDANNTLSILAESAFKERYEEYMTPTMQVYHSREDRTVEAYQYHSGFLADTLSLLLTLTKYDGPTGSKPVVSDVSVSLDPDTRVFVIEFTTIHGNVSKRLTLKQDGWIVLDSNQEVSIMNPILFRKVFM